MRYRYVSSNELHRSDSSNGSAYDSIGQARLQEEHTNENRYRIKFYCSIIILLNQCHSEYTKYSDKYIRRNFQSFSSHWEPSDQQIPDLQSHIQTLNLDNFNPNLNFPEHLLSGILSVNSKNLVSRTDSTNICAKS